MTPRTILVADDEPDNRAIMKAALTASGYRVVVERIRDRVGR